MCCRCHKPFSLEGTSHRHQAKTEGKNQRENKLKIAMEVSNRGHQASGTKPKQIENLRKTQNHPGLARAMAANEKKV